MPTGYLVGAFDVFGVLDLDVIRQLGERGYRTVVGVLDDSSIQRLHGRVPLIPVDERLQLISHVRGVHDAIVHPANPDAVPGWPIFAISGEPVPAELASVIRIAPRRESQSRLLGWKPVVTIDPVVA